MEKIPNNQEDNTDKNMSEASREDHEIDRETALRLQEDLTDEELVEFHSEMYRLKEKDPLADLEGYSRSQLKGLAIQLEHKGLDTLSEIEKRRLERVRELLK